MSINYAILGILSEGPQTGYDVKKTMQESPFLYWSGNNNQVYKALVELHDQGLVTQQVQHQDGAPSKKVYTITDAGLQQLKDGSLATPDLFEVKKPFLVQLAWSWQLSQAELQALLDQYRQEVQGRLLLEQGRLDAPHPARTPREGAIRPLLYENILQTYRQELLWIDQVRQTVDRYADPQKPAKPHSVIKGGESMNTTVEEKMNQKYIQVHADGKPLQTEQDGLDLIALCAQHGTHLLLIQGDALSEDFFRLRTGLAGAVAQKFAQYSIRAAIVMDPDRLKGKAKDFVAESNHGNVLRVYADPAEARHWLLGA